MEASSLFSPMLHSQPSIVTTRPQRKIATVHQKTPRTNVFVARNGAHDRSSGGRLVDENMIVLRKRIHEMKMIERNYEPPAGWMDWEKRYYTCYDSDVCHVVGLLQTMLMNTRPSLGIGLMALVALSVPTSTVLIIFHLMEAAKGVLSGI
ncbi:uncharacterized protein LOC131234697 [Magnolia sinica]|uniref:uncharacterized protein LOC131234697 n=1 Tax=Magnolia sinica TaxID=86752 RepID=UPI002657B256|nr:uncharacterized protein LOC131234697 [Magnolia sinica]